MTKAGFGEHLKREREMRGVSLDEICAATRIGNRFLEALENEEWDRLPGGVFNRGFVRAVARFLGLDEEAFVAEYLLATSEQNSTADWSKPQLAPPPASHRLRWTGILLGIVLIAAGAWSWRSYQTRRAIRRAPATSSTPLPDPTDAELPPITNAPPSLDDARTEASAPFDAPPADGAVLPQDNMLQLKIEAGKGTSLTVSADGSKVFDGSMIAGQSREFAAQAAFKVRTQDAGALLLELNGQTLAPIGPPGRSGEVVLTRADLKAAGGPH